MKWGHLIEAEVQMLYQFFGVNFKIWKSAAVYSGDRYKRKALLKHLDFGDRYKRSALKNI